MGYKLFRDRSSELIQWTEFHHSSIVNAALACYLHKKAAGVPDVTSKYLLQLSLNYRDDDPALPVERKFEMRGAHFNAKDDPDTAALYKMVFDARPAAVAMGKMEMGDGLYWGTRAYLLMVRFRPHRVEFGTDGIPFWKHFGIANVYANARPACRNPLDQLGENLTEGRKMKFCCGKLEGLPTCCCVWTSAEGRMTTRMRYTRASDSVPSQAGGSKRPRDGDTDRNDSGAPKRAKPEPGRSHAWESSDDTFWYHDGNVVVRVPGEGTLFKLHSSRLERECGYFKDLFDSPHATATIHFQGYPMYDAPQGITAKAFKDLLTEIEKPLAGLEFPPSQSHTVSLLETAHVLSCDAVSRLAENRLRELWDSRHVPTKAGPGDIRAYTDAIATIHLAREHDISGVLKRAFYELLSSEDYWEAYRADRGSMDLPHEDKERLRSRLWGEFILAVPKEGTVKRLTDEWCCYGYSDRGPNWRSVIVERGALKQGAMDPLRYNVVEKMGVYLKQEMWCEGCLGNKEREWEAKRTEWWGLLDELFDL
ncbi:hypothetical protein V8D89_014372 [Ganoderma adspersum]